MFIAGNGFFEAILAMINVADVYFEPGETPGIVELRKDFARALDGLKSLVVFAHEDHGLNGTA